MNPHQRSNRTAAFLWSKTIQPCKKLTTAFRDRGIFRRDSVRRQIGHREFPVRRASRRRTRSPALPKFQDDVCKEIKALALLSSDRCPQRRQRRLGQSSAARIGGGRLRNQAVQPARTALRYPGALRHTARRLTCNWLASTESMWRIGQMLKRDGNVVVSTAQS